MRTYLIAFVIAAAVAGAVTPLVRRIALRYQILSSTGSRHAHAHRIPRLGGVGLCLALFAPIVGLFFMESAVAALFQSHLAKVVGLCAGGIAMCTLGAVDDTRGLRALHKLYAQVAIATFAYFCGFRIDAVLLPYFGELTMGVLSLPVTVLWIVGITNAVNLIDGLDGLAAGVVFFAGVTNLVVAIIAGQTFVALILAAMLGAVLAFLFYNFNPARIFMGDSGSYMLGYVLAVSAVAGAPQKASTAVALLVPVVALGVPIFDTMFAMVRRVLERRPMFSPDRGHIHHRLLDLGITHRRVVLILYGVSILFIALAIAVYMGRSWQVGLALLISTVMLLGMVGFVGYSSRVHAHNRQRARARSRDTEMLRHILPSVSERFARAEREGELVAELVALAQEAELAALEINRIDAADDHDPLVSWRKRRSGAPAAVSVASFPLGRDASARALLTVSVINDFDEPEMSLQSDILLQVVADMLASNLRRVGSDWAPRQSEISKVDGQVVEPVEEPSAPAVSTALNNPG